MEAVFDSYIFLATHDSYVGVLSDLESKFLIERTADIALLLLLLLFSHNN